MNEIEIWKDIPGYEGCYQVNNLGSVKSIKDNKGNFREKIMKQFEGKNSYLRIFLRKNGKGKNYSCHRLIAAAFHGLDLDDPKQLACHKDDLRSNNREDNIYVGTHKDNSQDRDRKGRSNTARGERHGSVKLTESQVLEIRNTYTGKHGEQKKFAQKYGVDPSAIWYLLHGISWKTI